MSELNPLCPICSEEDCDHTQEMVADHLRRVADGHDPLVDTSDATQVAARARTLKQREKQAKADFKFIMSDARGRRHVWALLERCGVYRSSYVRGEGTLAGMSFAEGERNIGLELLDRCLREVPDGYSIMVKENGGKS